MNSGPLDCETQTSQTISRQERYPIAISSLERWAVYHRLQELDLNCHCAPSQPLQVEILTPLAALQLWSVVWSSQACRSQLIDHLQTCWQKSI